VPACNSTTLASGSAAAARHLTMSSKLPGSHGITSRQDDIASHGITWHYIQTGSHGITSRHGNTAHTSMSCCRKLTYVKKGSSPALTCADRPRRHLQRTAAGQVTSAEQNNKQQCIQVSSHHGILCLGQSAAHLDARGHAAAVSAPGTRPSICLIQVT
jgi:hypothetical protein